MRSVHSTSTSTSSRSSASGNTTRTGSIVGIGKACEHVTYVTHVHR